MKRKGIIALLLSALMLLSATSVFASTPSINFNGQNVDVAAVIVDGRTLLPARDIVDLLGGTTDWNGELRQVTIQQGTTNIILTIDNTTAMVNGAPVTLDVPPQIVNDRTKVPLAFVGVNLGVNVSFSDGSVFISSEPAVAIQPTPEPLPTPEPAPEHDFDAEQMPVQQPPVEQILVGTWIWSGIPYYVFEADGRGTMSGMDIRWTTNRGILTVCTTPELCGNTCLAPQEWYYVVEGNRLTLTSRLLQDMTFTYTRR